MDESCEGSNVGRIEDDDYMLHFGAVLLDVLAELGCNLAVALQQVFASHAFLAGSTTAGNDVLGACESLSRIDGIGDVCTGESTMAHLVVNAMNTGFVDVIQANVWGKAEHQNALHHVRADHTAGTNDNEFLVCQEFHDCVLF